MHNSDGFADLARLFKPRAIAVVGASTDPRKIGTRPIVNLQRGGYEGRIVPINPRHDEILGLQCWPSIEASQLEIDLALIASPPEHNFGVVEDCVASQVPFASVFTSGYAETGQAGRERQESLVNRARAGGLRLLGPNTLGFTSAPNRMIASFSTVFDKVTSLRPARIGFISQSGALGAIMCGLMDERGAGFSRFVSIGNEADLDVADFLSFLAADPETAVVGGYLENVKDGARFLRAAAQVATADKPMSFLKVGRSEQGARATQSHTGALAGSDIVYDAALRQSGIVRAKSLHGLMDFLKHHADHRPIDGAGGVGVLTVSGGAGVWMADRMEDLGVPMADLAPSTVTRLKQALPSFASPVNPVDATGHIVNDPALLGPALEALLGDPGVACVVLMMGLQESNGGELASSIADLAARTPQIPLFVVWLAGPVEAYEVLERRSVPVFDDMSRCIDAVADSFAASRLARKAGERTCAPAPEVPAIAAATGLMLEHDAKAVLRSVGILTPSHAVCYSLEEALDACDEIGFPVVMKGLVAGVSHKSEHGLVKLALPDRESAAEAYSRLVELTGAAASTQAVSLVLVEAMAGPGLDMMVGVVQDAAFGPVVMTGLGGVNVELFSDRSVRVAPVSPNDALDMISELKAAKLLDGYRGGPPMDRTALANTISTISHLAVANTWIQEIEINPLRIFGGEEPPVALDAVLVGNISAESL